MFARTRPVLRRSTSLKWTHEQQQQQHHHMKRMPSPSPTRILKQQHSNIPHVQSMPKLTSPSIVKSVHIPVQSPPPHAPHQSTPHPHPRLTLHPSRPSPMAQSSSLPALSPVATPTRPPLLRRVVTPTRPSPLRRTSAHMDGTTFERVTRRRLLSPTPITTSSSSTTTITAPPPSPTSPTRRRIPRRFTFAPIHIVTSQLRDSNVIEMEHDRIRHQHQYEQENMTPAKDLVKWWAERESPIWQQPPALHTLIEDDWEERQQPFQHRIAPSTQTSCTSPTSNYTSTSSRTPLRPPPILLPHTVSATPAYRYNPITPTCPNRELELQSPPPFCRDNEIANVMLSPSFANLSMDVDMMAQLPQGWQSQDMGQVTPTSTTWTPRVMDELTHDISKWINMDTQ